MPARLKATLFDLGGTLIEYENLTWQEMSRRGFELAFERLKGSADDLPDREEFVRLFDEYFESRYRDSLETLVEVRVTDLIGDCFNALRLPGHGFVQREFLKAYYSPVTRQITMARDAPRILDHLKGSGLKLALVSNTIFPGEFHRQELKRFGLIDFFEHLTFSFEVGLKKPHPVIFKKALEALGVQPGEAVFLGDRLKEDVAGPKSVGMRAVLRVRKGQDYSRDVTPDAIVTDLAQVPEVIAELALEK